MKEPTMQHCAKVSRYLVMTDRVNYWRKNVKEVLNLTSFLEDEKIDYVVFKIEDMCFFNKKAQG